jgi:nucleoside-diphosphate-sugar epimerase
VTENKNGRKKILITGATGQVARPIAEALAAEHEVWALGRFSTLGVKDQLRAKGVLTWSWDMGRDTLDGLPSDFTHVLHAAAERGDNGDFDTGVEINAAGVGRLMNHCRTARAFIYISSGVVYAQQHWDHLYTETDPLGCVLAWLPVYPVVKVASEGAVRAFSTALGLPTVIARLNVPYGPNGYGGVPVLLYRQLLAGKPIAIPHKGQNLCSPIHAEDLVRQVSLLWEVASSPALVLNWGGDEVVGLQDCLEYIAGITEVKARFERSDVTRQTCAFDNTKRHALIGGCSVHWKEGVRRTIESHFPGSIKTRVPAALAR